MRDGERLRERHAVAVADDERVGGRVDDGAVGERERDGDVERGVVVAGGLFFAQRVVSARDA